MKELLLQYAQYNVWANKRIIDAMLQLEDGAADQEITSSFPTIRKTVGHTWSAESIWLQRLQHVEDPIWQEPHFTGSFEDMCREWNIASMAIVKFLEDQDDNSLQATLSFHYRNGDEGNMSVAHVLHHVFNHSTYHRGQLVTMLRQAGATDIPGTDFVSFIK